MASTRGVIQRGRDRHASTATRVQFTGIMVILVTNDMFVPSTCAPRQRTNRVGSRRKRMVAVVAGFLMHHLSSTVDAVEAA